MNSDEPGKEKDGDPTQAGQNLQPGSGQTSAIDQITSKIEADKQYSGADALKLVQDALSADGREQKDRAEKAEALAARLKEETTELATKYNTVSSQISELLKAQNEAEAEKVKDDPVALSSLRARQANAAEALRLQNIAADYEAKHAKLIERETEVAKKATSINIKLAATAAGVDEKTLADLVPDGDPERLKKAANILKQSGINKPPEIDPATGKPKPAALTQPPASAISAGGESRSVSEKMLEDAKKK